MAGWRTNKKSFLTKAGFETETVEGGIVAIKSFPAQLMKWEEPQAASSSNSSVS